ncbi:MAG: carboxypeptidase-like regulatory domain-containing protein, partial [Candidatus Diapherotrites archaeon]
MGLRDAFHSMEDKWYEFLDRLQEKGVPIYSVIDPIDKVIPSLALFLALILVLIAGTAFVLLQPTGPRSVVPGENVSLEINVSGNGFDLSNAEIEIEFDEESDSKKTNSNGKAVFNVPIDSRVFILVSKEGYYNSSREFVVSEDSTENFSLDLVDEAYESTFIFTSPNGQSMNGTKITAVFSCSNEEYVFDESRNEILEGEISILVPEGCGTVLIDVTVDDARYENKKYSSNGGIIRLSAKTELKGNLLVVINSNEGTPLNSIEVTAKSGTQVFGPFYTNSSGEAQLELIYGTYRIYAEDPLEKYASSVQAIEFMTEFDSIRMTMSKDPFAKINLTAVDSESDESIPAKFFIRKGTEVTELESTEEDLTVSFLAEEAGVFYVRAAKDKYISGEEKEIALTEKAQEEDLELLLKPCTPTTCAALKIKVIDEDGLAVENAVVNLHDTNTGFIKTEYAQRSTDVNGEAKPNYSAVEPGTYYASAIRFPAEGKSPEFEVREGNESLEITIEVVIGTTNINLVVADQYGEAIDFADVELINADNSLIGLVKTDAQGQMFYEGLKAGKDIYIKVTKEEFTSWTSELIMLYPNMTINLTAVLFEEELGDTPEIKFLGLYEKNSETIIDLPEPARSYDAKFEVTVPLDADFESAGMHLRLGEMDLLEKDYLMISKINAPNTLILKGTKYDEEEQEDVGITNGPAKWANITWINPDAGKYVVKAEVKVLPSTPPMIALPVYFRTWGKEDNQYFRDPIDEELGLGEETEEKKSLFANTYSKIYYEENMEEACVEEFCFFNSVLDLTEDVFLNEPFNLRISNDYNLSFNIVNNTGDLHDEANLRIKVTDSPPSDGEGVRIESYKIYNSDLLLSESNTPLFELPRIELGEWKPNKSVHGTLLLDARNAGQTYIQMEIVSGQEIVFSRLIAFNNYFENEQELTIEPEVIPAFSETIMEITSLYKTGTNKGKPVVGADVLVERETSTFNKSSYSAKTDSRGKAVVMIPASSPGTTLKITSRKPDLAPAEKELVVSGQVLLISPEAIAVELNSTTKSEEKIPLILTSTINQLQKIYSMRATGKTKGLLDALKMENFHYQFVGTQIDAEEEQEISALMALSIEASDLLWDETLKGNLLIETVSGSALTKWFSEIPFTVSIDSGKEVQEKGCLVVTPKEWNESIFEDSSTIQIEVFNNCTDKAGNPMDLENVSAKIAWTSNPTGLVELTLIDAEEGMETTETLVNGRRMILFEELPAESYLTGYAKFTALRGHTGETAKFSVELNAEIPSGDGEYEFVGSDGAINGAIQIIDLASCISFTPNPQVGLIIPADADEGEFSIDTSACGDLTLDFMFCDRGRDRCRGQATEGGIIVSPWELKNVKPTTGTNSNSGNSNNSGTGTNNSGTGNSNNNATSGTTVKVQREQIPGIYGIK